MHMADTNAKREKMKSVRTKVQPYLEKASSIAEAQYKDGHDFVIEIPHALSSWKHEGVHVTCFRYDKNLCR